jgi:ubiquinone biosynthesis protein
VRLGRIAEISKVFLDEGLGYLTESRQPGEKGEEGEHERPPESEVAVRLRRTLEKLGPTFVKFGQLLGTRVDLFSEEVIAELGKLHSSVPPFPHDQARAIIEEELGAKIEDVFDEFPEEPIAAASIAQVYEARLKGDADGWVAVKVQRPGLELNLLSDLEVLIQMSGFFDRLVPPYRAAMVHRIAEEYASRARQEIDFLAEAEAIEKFSEVLTTLPEFRAPAVHRDLSTPRLLVMEWLEGRKLDTVKQPKELTALGFDPESFGRSMLRLQVSMSYEHGFVHGDTHPGNIILLPTGQIGLIDFGLHGHVPRVVRDKMLEIIFYQASGRVDEAVEAYVQVFSPDPTLDIEEFKAELKEVMSSERTKASVGEYRVTEQLIEGMRVGARYRLKAPSELFMVIRNLTIVEGIVLRFSPQLKTTEELQQITGAIMRRRLFGPSMREELTQLLPHVLLTLSKRPRTAEKLLRLERSFSEAKNLGDFLRREQVIRDPAPVRGHGWMMLAFVATAGAAAGYFLHAFVP